MGIGIEITDTSIFIVETSEKESTFLIERMKTISLPPKAVVGGEIQDPDALNDLLRRTLDEGGFSNQPLHIAIKSNRCVKRICKILNAASSNIDSEIEIKVSQSYIFSKEEFSFGFQPMVPVDQDNPLSDSVAVPFMYIGMDKNKVDATLDLMHSLEKDILSIEHSSISHLRSLVYSQSPSDQEILICISIHDTFIDISIVKQKFVLYTHLFYKESHYVIEDIFFHEELSKRIVQVLMGYKNMYPKYPMPSVGLFFSHTYPYTELFNYLTNDFPFISFRVFSWQSFQLDTSFSSRKDLNEEGLSDYMGAVGLAIKSSFEFLPISLIKVKRKLISPLSKLETNIVLFLIFFITVLGIGSRFYLVYLSNKVNEQLAGVQLQLKSLQSGDYLNNQKQLAEKKSNLNYYTTILKANSGRSIEIMKILTQELPSDIAFSSVKIDKDSKVYIKGASCYSDSIYKFYNRIKGIFEDSNISGIETVVSPDTSIRENRFSIDFTWRAL